MDRILSVLIQLLNDDAEALDDLFLSVPIVQLLSLHQLSVPSRQYTSRALRQQLCFRRILEKFLFSTSEIEKFLQLQRNADFYISGSQALQFFLNVEWPHSDLDIFCWPHTDVDLMMTIFSELEYYPETQPPNFEEYYGLSEQISHVTSLRRIKDLAELKVQLVFTRTSPLDAILHFHSTAVMNFVTWQHAVCLYPHYTLRKRQAIACLRDVDAFRKYQQRGFSIIHTLPVEDLHDELRMHTRRVGDKYSLVIRILNIDPVTKERLDDAHHDVTPFFFPMEHCDVFTKSTHAQLRSPPLLANVFVNSWSIIFDVIGSDRVFKNFSVKAFLQNQVTPFTYTCSPSVFNVFRALQILEGNDRDRLLETIVRRFSSN